MENGECEARPVQQPLRAGIHHRRGNNARLFRSPSPGPARILSAVGAIVPCPCGCLRFRQTCSPLSSSPARSWAGTPGRRLSSVRRSTWTVAGASVAGVSSSFVDLYAGAVRIRGVEDRRICGQTVIFQCRLCSTVNGETLCAMVFPHARQLVKSLLRHKRRPTAPGSEVTKPHDECNYSIA